MSDSNVSTKIYHLHENAKELIKKDATKLFSFIYLIKNAFKHPLQYIKRILSGKHTNPPPTIRPIIGKH